MVDRYIHCNVLSFLFGCIACLSMTSVINADGRVFLTVTRGSSDLQGFRGAERACSMQNARLASAAELRHAVLECSFSICTRGWLYDGTVGSTECRNVGSSMKAKDVRTENSTEDMTNLDAFCIKDKGEPCGDPPSFPSTRLEGQAGFQMGDELMYVCAPGYVMPGGHTAFSLLCDSCGEWYGLVHTCLRDESETHVDYEDKFTDGYGAPEDHVDRGEILQVAAGEVAAEVHVAAHPEEQSPQGQQDTIFNAGLGQEHRDHQGEEARGEELSLDQVEVVPGFATHGTVDGVGKDAGAIDKDSFDLLGSEQDREVLVRSDAAMATKVTEAPVSLLSQKHMFWFPSEAFQEVGYPIGNDPVTQIATPDVDQSEESKENENKEGHHPKTDDLDDHDDSERKGYYDNDHNDQDEDSQDEHHDDHDDSHSEDQNIYGDSHDDHDGHDNSHQEDHDNSRQEDHDNSRQDDHDDHVDLEEHVKHYIPGQPDNPDRYGRYDDDVDHIEHYDMGEHEDERGHVLYGGGKEDEDRDDDESYDEDHDEDEGRYDEESEDLKESDHPEDSEEHLVHDGETSEHDNNSDSHTDHYDDHDQTDHEHDKHNSYEDHDDDDDDDGHLHTAFPVATDGPRIFTPEERERKPATTTDQSWLDGYPVGPEEVERGGSTQEGAGPEQQEEELLVGVTDKPNEVDVRRPIHFTDLPKIPERPTREPDADQGIVAGVWPGLLEPSASPSLDSREFLDSILYPNPPNRDTHNADPTLSWDKSMVAQTGQAGERAPVEGETGEATCPGGDCPPPPPPTSSNRGPVVAAVIVAVCAVAMAAMVGAWLYRRRQQKNSMYQLNGKGHGQSPQDQQMEMQQKV